MTGYITKIENFHYFAEIDKIPNLDSFIVQGKVKAVYYYTFDDSETDVWMSENPFSRKRKINSYSRPISLTDDPRLGIPNFTEEQLVLIKNTDSITKIKL